MDVALDIVGVITGGSNSGPQGPRGVLVEPTFYTGNKKSAVSFIRSRDKDGEILDEIMLQVNDEGKLTIARKRDI